MVNGFITILTRSKKNRNYIHWPNLLNFPYKYEHIFCSDWEPSDNCLAIVTHDTYRYTTYEILHKTLTGNIPVLILADGILDYRNCWIKKHESPAGIFNPILGHKLACIGNSQARFIDSWNNPGKCEIIGIPRLDGIVPCPLPPPSPYKILVCSANTPWFNQIDKKLIIQSFIDLQNIAQQLENSGQYKFHWRLTGKLPEILGISEDNRCLFEEIVSDFHAVVTTPSTVAIESMYHRRPTAILNYPRSPLYVPSAWEIHNNDGILPILHEIITPPEPKLIYQETILNDTLQLKEKASPRLAKLVDKMVKIGVEARRQKKPLHLPAKLLSSPEINADD